MTLPATPAVLPAAPAVLPAGPGAPSGSAPQADLLDRAWVLSPRVSLRPESFGALLYHFGTRRLSFLKDRRLLDVVQHLPAAPSARQACLRAGLGPDELPVYARALATLAATTMIVPRDSTPEASA